MKTMIRMVLLFPLMFISCLSAEEKKAKAEKEGNLYVTLKAKLLKGAGEALQTDGKEAVEAASAGIGEVVKGISSGYDKSINQANVLPDSLFNCSFELGHTQKMYADTVSKKRVAIYLIAKTSYNGKVKLRAFDKQKREIGRSIQHIALDSEDAKFFDFEFDNRTPLLNADYFIISQ